MIQVNNLTFGYHRKTVLKDVSFRIEPGEFVGIIGPNGAGKSTLLKLLDGILTPAAGHLSLHGKEIKHYSRREFARIVGYVPQLFTVSFHFTAEEIVAMGRFPHQGAGWRESTQDRLAVERAMELTECKALRHRDFFTLSGGERQRVILASALAQEPEILLLDEPTTALDVKHQIHFYRILQRLSREERKTVLVVTHDILLALRFSQRLLVLKNGQLIADGPTRQVVTSELLSEVYEVPFRIFKLTDNVPVVIPELPE